MEPLRDGLLWGGHSALDPLLRSSTPPGTSMNYWGENSNDMEVDQEGNKRLREGGTPISGQQVHKKAQTENFHQSREETILGRLHALAREEAGLVGNGGGVEHTPLPAALPALSLDQTCSYSVHATPPIMQERGGLLDLDGPLMNGKVGAHKRI